MATAEQPGEGHNSMADVDYSDLVGILDELSELKKSVGEANGKLRARIKEILEARTWNKGALADIRKIAAMSETARADYLRTFEPMFEAMMAGVWLGEREDLFADEDGETERARAEAAE